MASFAILLVGDDENTDERHRFYANDVALWSSLLTHRFGLSPANTIALYARGGVIETSEPPGSFEARPATRLELDAAFARAQHALGTDDAFFFVVSNHGTRPPQPPAILLADRHVLTPPDLSALAERLPSQRQVYVFGQCGAGRFSSVAGTGRAVLAGCRDEQGTYIRKDDDHGRTFQWSEFLFNVALALGAETEGPAPHPVLRDAFAAAEQRSTHRQLTLDGEWPILVDPGGVTNLVRALR